MSLKIYDIIVTSFKKESINWTQKGFSILYKIEFGM